MNNDITPEWEEYLSNISATPGINPTAASELLQDKDRLFVHDPAKALLETWSYSEDNKYLEKAGTSGEEDLNEYLDVGQDESINSRPFTDAAWIP